MVRRVHDVLHSYPFHLFQCFFALLVSVSLLGFLYFHSRMVFARLLLLRVWVAVWMLLICGLIVKWLILIHDRYLKLPFVGLKPLCHITD